jgi:hypothetical protein
VRRLGRLCEAKGQFANRATDSRPRRRAGSSVAARAARRRERSELVPVGAAFSVIFLAGQKGDIPTEHPQDVYRKSGVRTNSLGDARRTRRTCLQISRLQTPGPATKIPAWHTMPSLRRHLSARGDAILQDDPDRSVATDVVIKPRMTQRAGIFRRLGRCVQFSACTIAARHLRLPLPAIGFEASELVTGGSTARTMIKIARDRA